MTAWTTTPFPRKCGSRGCAVPAGQPMRAFKVETLAPWCADCVARVFGERPTDVVETTLPPPAALPLQALAERVRQRLLDIDVKRRAAGDDA